MVQTGCGFKVRATHPALIITVECKVLGVWLLTSFFMSVEELHDLSWEPDPYKCGTHLPVRLSRICAQCSQMTRSNDDPAGKCGRGIEHTGTTTMHLKIAR